MRHPVILSYYSPDELKFLEDNDTTKLKAIIYYFTQSFVVIPISCSECVPFDSLNFDVLRYEHLRLPDQSYVGTFEKYGFTLILTPVDALPYRYPALHASPVAPAETSGH